MLEQFTAVQAKAAAERRRRLLGVARVLEHFAPALAPTLAADGDGQGRRRRLQSARDGEGEGEARRRLQDGAASVSDGAIRRYLRGDGRATRRLATADADTAPASATEEAGDDAADDVTSEVEVEVASVRHVLRYLASTVALPALRRALALALAEPDPHTQRRLDGDAAAMTTSAADTNATAGGGAGTAPAAPVAAAATAPAAALVDVLEEEVYKGAEAGRVYVYIASDNEVVKEAFARYLSAQPNAALRFAPMRVKNKAHIVHAKNTGYLKGNGNSTGVMDLVLDWYALSLANFVFAWRRDTDMLSTFAQSAQRMTGHSEVPQRTASATTAAAAAVPAASGNGSDATTPPTAAAQYPNFLPLQPNANGYGGGAVLHGQGSRGFQLVPSRKYGLAWREF